MPRYYSIPFANVAVAAVQDLFEITAVDKTFELQEIVVAQSSDFGDSEAEGLQIVIKRGVDCNSGSGGSSVTPVSHNSHDTAATSTAKVNNTTQASGGTITTLRAEAFNIQAGYQYLPMPEQRPKFYDGQRCLVSITAPKDSLTVSGTIVIKEDR